MYGTQVTSKIVHISGDSEITQERVKFTDRMMKWQISSTLHFTPSRTSRLMTDYGESTNSISTHMLVGRDLKIPARHDTKGLSSTPRATK